MSGVQSGFGEAQEEEEEEVEECLAAGVGAQLLSCSSPLLAAVGFS